MSSYRNTQLILHTFETQTHNSMPLVVDDNTLAFHIGIRNKTLWHLIKNKDTFYKKFHIPQKDKNGKFKKYRYIQAPQDSLKAVHTVLNGIFMNVALPRNVAAYVKGTNCATAASKHVKKNVLIGIDITNFFNSTRRSWIRNYFINEIGYAHYPASLLANLCCCEDVIKDKDGNVEKTAEGYDKKVSYLPQGSPLSGYLANLVAWSRFGGKLNSWLLAEDSKWSFTIYSDDITLSHPDDLTQEEVDRVIHKVYSLVEEAGYAINTKKTRVNRSSRQQKVLGCVVNEKLNIPYAKYNKIRCLIHNCLTQGFDSQAKRCNKNSGEAVVQYIRGMLQYFKQIREDRYDQLNEKFENALAIHGLTPQEEIACE